jgi:LPXTG-motif cell wall-anchored protein
VSGVIAAVVLGMALPAYAHHVTVSGDTWCSDGNHEIQWSIANSESSHIMTIVTATAKIGSTDYSFVGGSINGSTVGFFPDTANPTTIVPGGVSGQTITLSVSVTWPDDHSDQKTANVYLPDSCTPVTTTTTSTSTTTTTCPPTTTTTVPETTTTAAPTTTTTVPETTTTAAPTTTTTVPETTTTAAPTTTTTVPETTTTVGETTTVVNGTTTIFTTTTTQPETTTTTPITQQGNTVPIVNQTTTSAPGAGNLPRTGSSSGIAVFFGLSCIAGGALMLIRRRRNWSH